MQRFAVVLALAGLAACASDAVPEIEPALTQPGAFVAVDGDEGMVLYRICDTLTLEKGTFVFLILYDVDPHTFDEARELAKDHALPRRDFQAAEVSAGWPHSPYQVVWFRSLTDEEKTLCL